MMNADSRLWAPLKMACLTLLGEVILLRGISPSHFTSYPTGLPPL